MFQKSDTTLSLKQNFVFRTFMKHKKTFRYVSEHDSENCPLNYIVEQTVYFVSVKIEQTFWNVNETFNFHWYTLFTKKQGRRQR